MSSLLQILGGLGVFLYGLGLMSSGLQQVAGNRLRGVLAAMTSNRFAGIASGFLITCAIQSSSATTVMIVSFANAGLLTLTQAIGPVMGANIGTTITAWLVSLFGFKVHIDAFALPIIGIGVPMLLIAKGKTKQWGEVLLGFGLLFLGLKFLKDGVPDLKSSPESLEFLRHFAEYGFGSILIFVAVGTLLTVIVQSSSATMAITITMAAKGWISYEMAAAMVLGENIGTTITATIAAMPANRTAKRVARTHTLFNLIGVAWILPVMPFALRFVDGLVPGNPLADVAATPTHLSAFHTMFNLTNTFLLMWFVPQIERVVTRFVPYSTDELEESKLQFIDTSLAQGTPELGIVETRKGLQRMLGVAIELFGVIRQTVEREDNVDDLVERARTLEARTDRMEEELVAFATELARHGGSQPVAEAVTQTVDMANAIERMGDHLTSVALNTQSARNAGLTFSKLARQEIFEMLNKVEKMLELTQRSLDPTHKESVLEHIQQLEDAVDALIERGRKNKTDLIVGGHLGVRSGLIHIQTMSDLELVADDCFHVVYVSEQEARGLGLKSSRPRVSTPPMSQAS